MAATAIGGVPAASTTTPVKPVTSNDLNAALREGLSDFSERRGDLIFIGIIYPVIGLVAAFAANGGPLTHLLFPLAAGLSILGPLTAIGFYELARRRESGLDSSWRHFLDVAKSPQLDGIAVVAVILIGLFAAWLIAAGLIYAAFFGLATPASLGGFISEVLTTPRGWGMIVVGNLVGLVFAVATLAISVFSLPMLVDRDVSAGEAIRASLAGVRANPVVMARWGVIVAALLVLGSIPAFLGLAVVLPWLGYATWHLYRRAFADQG
jgi:uncharacterized membrane protein